MRKILLITVIVLCAQRVAISQPIWASPNNDSHYVEVECSVNPEGLMLLNKKQEPALQYIGVLINMNRKKIKNGEWSIWVESYVKQGGSQETRNRVRAKMLSNTVKSYLISNYDVRESNFTTRNYSGTISKKQNITTVVIGVRYPLEKILTEQLVDWEAQDVARLTDMAKTDSSIVVHYGELSAVIPGVDTSKIYSPSFEQVTFSYKAPEPKLMDVKGDETSLDIVDVEYFEMKDEQNTLMSDSVLMAQKAIQDSLNSQTDNSDSSLSKKEKQRLRQEKMRAQKAKKQRQPSSEIYGDLTVALPNVELGAATDAAITPFLPLNGPLGAQNKQEPKKSSVNLFDTGYTPYPSLSGFEPKSISMGEPRNMEFNPILELETEKSRRNKARRNKVESENIGSEEFANSDFEGRKIRVKKARKTDLTPKVVFDEQGRMSIDATGFERSLNAKNEIMQERENRTLRAVEQRLLREQIIDQRLVERRAIQQAKGRFAVFGVGVNALTSAALIPSMQLEAYFSDRFSVLIEGFYSKWNYDNNYKFNILMVSPELRFFPMGERKTFKGLYVGVYGSCGHYNMRWNSRTGYQSDFLSAGLSLGYVLPIGQSGFHLEAGISAGYLNQWGDKYVYHQGDNYHIEPYKNTQYFYPTKIKVSFVYRIFNQKKIYEREND